MSLLFNVRSLLIIVNSRSPHTSFREAFAHHQIEVVIDHPQLLFQYLVNYDATSEVQSNICKYFYTSFWKGGLISPAMFDKGASELSPNGLTNQGTGGDVQNDPGCTIATTAGPGESKRDVVILRQGLAAPESGDMLVREPVEVTDQEWLSEESAEGSKGLSWDLIGIGARLSSQHDSTEDYDDREISQAFWEEKLEHELEDKTMKLQRAEESLKKAEQEVAKSASIIKILEAEVRDSSTVVAVQRKKIRDLESESQAKTEEYIAGKVRADVAGQEQIKLTQEYDRQLEWQDNLRIRLNHAMEDRKREKQKYDDLTNALEARYTEERKQVNAKLRVQHDEEVQDLKSKLDLSEETITDLKGKLKSKDMRIALWGTKITEKILPGLESHRCTLDASIARMDDMKKIASGDLQAGASYLQSVHPEQVTDKSVNAALVPIEGLGKLHLELTASDSRSISEAHLERSTVTR
jgi:hypothetical protein